MEKILRDLKKIEEDALKDIKSSRSEEELQKLKIEFTGRKSKLNVVLKQIKNVETENRAEVGKEANKSKTRIIDAIEQKKSELKKASLQNIQSKEWMDVTVPGKIPTKGNLHPITQMIEKSVSIFEKMGFEVFLPYEVDDDYHNFETVNMPADHPARDAWDTFWTKDDNILITHTSSMQNRILKAKEPPIRAIVPGKCFRNEATDARHEHTFYQIEGVYVDKGITMTDMLGTLQTYFESFFEQKIKIKFMPDYFPFVEPGGQIALSCVLCQGKGCKVCKQSGWLEILGCGMIHPNVLKMAGLDPDTFTGFAWGFGVERLILLKNNIKDIRLFHTGDLRFIQQFK